MHEHEHTYRFYIRQGEFELDVEGDRNFVESYVAAFLAGEAELERGKSVRARSGGKGSKRAKEPDAMSGLVDAKALQDYVKGRKLTSDGKRYMAFAMFLKSRGINEISAGLIRECYKALNIPYKHTSRQNLFLMKKAGKVSAGSQPGFYVLTPKGEAEAGKLGKRVRTAKKKTPARRVKRAKK